MPISPAKVPIILVVHGVQIGEDAELYQDQSIRTLVQQRMKTADSNLAMDFNVELYAYENIADDALDAFKSLSKLIVSSPIGTILAPTIIDLIGDVVLYLANNSTANQIRLGLKEKILSYFNRGHPLYLVAHSLGSVYAFDVINQLIEDDAFFNRNDPLNWPVQGLITIGSPLGLDLFNPNNHRKAASLGPGNFHFKWFNFYDVSDPIVSGEVFGVTTRPKKLAEDFANTDENQGWYIKDVPIDTGKPWLLAHTAYWNNSEFGDGLLNMMV